MADPFVGEIRVFPYVFAPTDWAFCWGQEMQIQQYQGLFAVIGTIYGGDGQTTFKLPNLTQNSNNPDGPGYVAVGAGAAQTGTNYTIGRTYGMPTVTLTEATMPGHGHTLQGAISSGTLENVPSATRYLSRTLGQQDYSNVASAIDTTLAGDVIGAAGGNGAHTNMQPTLRMNFCISLVGIFPMRP